MSDTIGVPPGRLDLKHDSQSLELLTIQHEDVYSRLQSDGVVLPDISKSSYFEIPTCATAYAWMSRTLAEGRETHESFDPTAGAMFWLWAHVTRRALVSDAGAYGPGHVLLRCRLPRQRVLLSDFDAYHGAFFGDLIYSEEELERAFADEDFQTPLQEELAGKYGYGWSLFDLEPQERSRVQATWANMLVSTTRREGRWTQACVSHLEAGDVISGHPLHR